MTHTEHMMLIPTPWVNTTFIKRQQTLLHSGSTHTLLVHTRTSGADSALCYDMQTYQSFDWDPNLGVSSYTAPVSSDEHVHDAIMNIAGSVMILNRPIAVDFPILTV